MLKVSGSSNQTIHSPHINTFIKASFLSYNIFWDKGVCSYE